MIPERLAWALIQDGWILRNKIIWFKKNSMPSSVSDRLTNRHEFMFLFSQQQKYYFDLDAIREPHQDESIKRACRAKHNKGKPYAVQDEREYAGYENMENDFEQGKLRDVNPLGKNPGDVMEISTQPIRPAVHFAVFPEKLCETPIKAGCPKGGIMLDPFAGTATVAFVARELGRRSICIEISKDYIPLAKRRMAQKNLFVEG